MNILQDKIQILLGKQDNVKKGLILSTWTKNCNDIIKTKDKFLNNVKSSQFMMIVTSFNVVLRIYQSCSFPTNMTIGTDLLDFVYVNFIFIK